MQVIIKTELTDIINILNRHFTLKKRPPTYKTSKFFTTWKETYAKNPYFLAWKFYQI